MVSDPYDDYMNRYYKNEKFLRFGKFGKGGYPKFFIYDKEKGIQRVILKNNKGVEPYAKEWVWIWENFYMIEVLEDEVNGVKKRTYTYMLNNTVYKDETIEQMRKRLNSCAVKERSIFGIVRMIIMKQTEYEIYKVEKTLGYTKDGWILPNDCRFKSSDMFSSEIYSGLKTMIDLDIDMEKVEIFKEMVEIMGMPHKDIVLSYLMIAPFLHTLKSNTELSPLLTLVGPNQVGKSHISKLGTYLTWNNIKPVNPENLDSKPRTRDLLSVSTFPILIDEAETLNQKVLDIFKITATTETMAKTMNKDGSAKENRPFCTPTIITCNELPTLFYEKHFKTRCFIIKIPNHNGKEGTALRKLKSQLGKGYIGRYIYERTKKINKQSLLNAYYNVKIPTSMDFTDREECIFRLITIGAKLFHWIFNIELDITRLSGLVKRSNEHGSLHLFDVVIGYINEEYGDVKPYKMYELKDGKKELVGYQLTSDHIETMYKHHSRHKELFERVKGPKNLYEILKTKWKDVEYNNSSWVKAIKRTSTNVFIPVKYLKGIIDVNDLSMNAGTNVKE